jgi:hypothetical protein
MLAIKEETIPSAIVNSIRVLNKQDLRRHFKHLTQSEYTYTRGVLLEAEFESATFEEFLAKVQSADVPLPRLDAYAFMVYIERYHNGAPND